MLDFFTDLPSNCLISGCCMVILTVHVPFPPLNVLTMISPTPGAFGRRHTSFRGEWYSRLSRQLTPLMVNSEKLKVNTQDSSPNYPVYVYIGMTLLMCKNCIHTNDIIFALSKVLSSNGDLCPRKTDARRDACHYRTFTVVQVSHTAEIEGKERAQIQSPLLQVISKWSAL